MVVPWPIEQETVLASFRIGGMARVRARSPRTGLPYDFYELRFPDWINVVPIAPDGRVLLIRQFRVGTRSLTLEIPGGLLEPGETPEAAARRELREETGCEAAEWRLLGMVHPNPAIQSNRCFTFLARGAAPVGPPALDPGEDIDVVPTDLGEIPALIAGGAITHTLVISAFAWLSFAALAGDDLPAFDLLRGAPPAGGGR
jgi:8-oxo-dGTP pyrophosphatase MutT (NUDIX family)